MLIVFYISDNIYWQIYVFTVWNLKVKKGVKNTCHSLFKIENDWISLKPLNCSNLTYILYVGNLFYCSHFNFYCQQFLLNKIEMNKIDIKISPNSWHHTRGEQLFSERIDNLIVQNKLHSFICADIWGALSLIQMGGSLSTERAPTEELELLSHEKKDSNKKVKSEDVLGFIYAVMAAFALATSAIAVKLLKGQSLFCLIVKMDSVSSHFLLYQHVFGRQMILLLLQDLVRTPMSYLHNRLRLFLRTIISRYYDIQVQDFIQLMVVYELLFQKHFGTLSSQILLFAIPFGNK